MKKFLIFVFILILSFTSFSQENRDKESPIKSYKLIKGKKIAPSKRNPFLKKEEIILGDLKEEKKEELISNVPSIVYKGYLSSKNKKIALIQIDGTEAMVEEGEEIMNLKIIAIKENEIEVQYLLTKENLKIKFSGGED